MFNHLMMEKYVEVSWCPADIKAMRPTWSDEKCMAELERIAKWLEEAQIESGWDSMDFLIEPEEEDEDEVL